MKKSQRTSRLVRNVDASCVFLAGTVWITTMDIWRFEVGDHVCVGAAGEYEGRVGIITETYELRLDPSAPPFRFVVLFLDEGKDAVFFGLELEPSCE